METRISAIEAKVERQQGGNNLNGSAADQPRDLAMLEAREALNLPCHSVRDFSDRISDDEGNREALLKFIDTHGDTSSCKALVAFVYAHVIGLTTGEKIFLKKSG